MRQTPWSRIRGRNSVIKEPWEIVGSGKPTGSVLNETIAVSVTISINRAKMTRPNSFPSSCTRQNERNASRTRSPRGKSPSGRMSRLPCKDYLKGTCTNSFCEKWHPLECLFYKTKSGCKMWEKCSYAHRQVEEQPSKRYQKNGDKSAVALLKRNEQPQRTGRPCFGRLLSSSTRQLVAYIRIWSRRSLHRFCGSAQTYGNQSRWCKIFTKSVVRHADIETKIHRSDIFAQVILISVTPMLQNLRIGLKRRQSGKSKAPAKQRGSWPKV